MTTRSSGSCSPARPIVPAIFQGTSARHSAPSLFERMRAATAGETYAVPGAGIAGVPSGTGCGPVPGAVRKRV